MKFENDPPADALCIRLAAGKVPGIEMLDVSLTADSPRKLAVEVPTRK